MYATTGTLVLIRLHKKADLLEMKVNNTKVQTKKCFDLGRDGGHKYSKLGSGLFMVRQANDITETLKFTNFNLKHV